jgi:hypothetical protein
VNYHRAASSAIAPTIVPGYSCAGGKSFALQGLGGGVSLGDATPSAVCETIYQAESVKAMGDHSAAFEVMCDLPQVRAARKRAGNLCWADRPENQPKAGEPTDPYVRKRMGLPPL